jgi:hypothetical protein
MGFRVVRVRDASSRFWSVRACYRAFREHVQETRFLRLAGVLAPSVPVCLRQPDGRATIGAEQLEPDMVDPVTIAAGSGRRDLCDAGPLFIEIPERDAVHVMIDPCPANNRPSSGIRVLRAIPGGALVPDLCRGT